MEILDSITQIAYTLMISLNIATAHDLGKKPVDNAELFCLAQNVYFEARAESVEGKIAVASVSKNRIRDPKNPKTYCGVIHQGPKRESWKTRQDPNLSPEQRIYIPVRNRCQFSWTCDGIKDIIWVQYKDGTPIEANRTAWRDSVNVAILVMRGQVKDNTGGAVYYYAHNTVYPGWASSMSETVVIGDHTFMKR